MEILEPWYSIKDDPALVASLTKELLRELSVGHPLYGLQVRAVGRRLDCDDVLFAIEDGSGQFVVVHLTWKGAQETLPWPGSTRYLNFSAWVAEGMRHDRDDFFRGSDEDSDSPSESN